YAEGYVEIPGKGSARGSSFAVPKAVMTAALAWQVNGNINSGQLREIIVAPTLEANADPPGRLNSQASLEMAKNYTPSFFPVWGSPSFDFHQPFGFLW
ncbi:MAG: hypothetical protein NC834_05760, partial [Candidatus Omnitrophica bacterium]|nr:hypothetical protein [Candidatus Omnitrophota bacterium]